MGALWPTLPCEPWLFALLGPAFPSALALFCPPLEKSSEFPSSPPAKRDAQTFYTDEESWGEQSDGKLGPKALFQSLLCLEARCFGLDCMLPGVGWGSNGG